MPLLVDESETPRASAIFEADPVVIAWWASEVECISALAGRERDGMLSPSTFDRAVYRLDSLARSWHEIQPAEQVRSLARRVLRLHPLRVADSLQLAAAIVAAEGHPASLELVSFDDRLADAARREGFRVVGRTEEREQAC